MPQDARSRYRRGLQRSLRFTQRHLESVSGAPAQKMPVAVLGHPARTCEMSGPNQPRPVRFGGSVNVEHDVGDLTPIRAVRFGVEQPQIGDEMLLVVCGQNRIGWNNIGDRRIE